MAFVINSDGTVSVFETKTDDYGYVKPIGSCTMRHSDNTPVLRSISSNSKPQKKKLKNTSRDYILIERELNALKAKKKEQSIPMFRKDRLKRTITNKSVDDFFARKKKCKKIVTIEEVQHAMAELNSELSKYFMEKYSEYKKFCVKVGWLSPKIIKNEEKKNEYRHNNATHFTNNSIANIAIFSTLKDSLSNDNVKFVKNKGGRVAKYGYARDKYGRVKGSDLLNEDLKNEFKQAHKQQSNYDYSNYDSEDDNDSYYDSIFYD